MIGEKPGLCKLTWFLSVENPRLSHPYPEILTVKTIKGSFKAHETQMGYGYFVFSLTLGQRHQ